MESKKRVFLLVDDQPENLISLKALVLEAFPNSKVLTAANGTEGLALAKEHEPDVVMLDILMPGMDGYEVCRRMKQDPALQTIPVLFVTALKNDKETRLKAIKSGGESFINKPIDDIELYVQLRSMLKIRDHYMLEKLEKQRLNELVDNRTHQLMTMKEKYQHMLDDLPALICEFNPEGTLTYVNKSYCRYFYKSEEELLGTPFDEFTQLDEKSGIGGEIMVLNPLRPMYRYIRQTRHMEENKWQEWRIRGIFDDEGAVQHLYAIGIDITQRKEGEDRLLYMSYHDHLTGLYNRRYFEEELKRLDKKRNLPLTIMMADVNGLKLINDSFGHPYGDKLLVKAAEAIAKGCRADDIVARIGGDEFAVILTHTTGEDADKLIKRIRENIENENKDMLALSVSIGFETKKADDQSINETFAGAENYMYRQKMYDSASIRSKTIDLIMSSLFEKSEREMAHSKRVSQLCGLIASGLGFDNEAINKIKISGLLHDIGKIGVDEKILNKAGGLNPEEWKEIKKHPEAGWRILSSVREFNDVAKCAISHHERWDGQGYPQKLSGYNIPLEARILAVADAYDAMTSERSYRAPMSKEEAINELKKNAGSQFDPEIVKAFIKIA
jgi:diguanylate cyclase (GGDEF)-like protein/PAS domain S-box-containing protein/putative nucleotidyltransferase with HDIG domain